jgi:anti-sigma factor RsiW
MRDCPNSVIRELLPDLINDRLTAHERAEVHAHLNTCADCRAELELLERVRASVRRTPVDVGRIVAAVPAYKRSRWRALSASPLARAAAVVVIALGGALLLRSDDPQVVESVPRIPSDSAPAQVATQTAPSVPSRAPVTTSAPSPELAMGEMFEDLTDSELEALLKSLGTIEAVTPVETEVVPPAVNREGS